MRFSQAILDDPEEPAATWPRLLEFGAFQRIWLAHASIAAVGAMAFPALVARSHVFEQRAGRDRAITPRG